MAPTERESWERTPERLRREPKGESDSIRVARRVDGTCEATFVLRLAGVAGATGDARSPRQQTSGADLAADSVGMRALFAQLRPEQQIVWNYRLSQNPEGNRTLDLLIYGQAATAERKTATESARSLQGGLKAALATPLLKHLDFVTIQDSQDADLRPGLWSCEIAPLGIAVPCGTTQSIGFTAPSAVPGRVVLAQPIIPNPKPFDALPPTVGISGDFFRLSVEVSPIILSKADRELALSAYHRLCTGGAGQIGFATSDRGRIFDSTLLQALAQQLEQWLGDPRGYRVRCILHADHPLDPTLLQIMGSDLYWGGEVALRFGPSMVTGSDDRRALRLDNCLHRSACPPNLAPSADFLRLNGVPKIYRQIPGRRGTDGIYVGLCGGAGDEQPIYLSDADRSRHCYIMGATGTGKSTLLRRMITQDIQRGEGLCLIDPHGDLFEQVLAAIPPARAEDVIAIDMADFEHCFGLNFLECTGPFRAVETNFIVNEMMTIFDRLYDLRVTGGPMFETYMRNALLVLMESSAGTPTLLDVVRFFEDRNFRANAKKRSTNPIAVSFWERQAERAGGEASLENMTPYVTAKLNQFTHNALLRPVIGQRRSTVDFRAAMDQGRILLVNLAKGMLGDLDMRLLGMLLIGKLFNAALGRVKVPLAERRRFHLYIDEFQTLVTPTVGSLLSEARKFGLTLTMANQHLTQLAAGPAAPSTLEAVLGNAATLLFFRVGPRDAELLQSFTLPQLGASDLQGLPDFHAACRVLGGAGPMDPFVLRLGQPDPRAEGNQGLVAAIRRKAHGTYLNNREQVEKEIMAEWSG